MASVFNQNLRAWAVTAAGAAGYVGLCSFVGKRRMLPKRLQRKLMHIGTGPFYLLCWPLYSSSSASPWICATVPLLASVQFILVGTGVMPDALGLVPGATRSGRRQELLRGPLLYGMVHAAMAGLVWCSPAAVVSLAVLCGGDGMAEVIGQSVRSPPLPWNASKTVAGSMACAAGGASFGLLLMRYFIRAGAIALPPGSAMAAQVALCALVGAVVESLPLAVEGADNVTVPLAVALTSKVVFGA